MNTPDDPGQNLDVFLSLLGAVGAEGGRYGAVLRDAGLDVASFERICWAWLTYCRTRPQLDREVTPQIRAALELLARPPIDELIESTLALPGNKRAPAPALPFAPGNGAPPVAGSADPPRTAAALVGWGDTLATSESTEARPALPFAEPGATSHRLPLPRVAELVATAIVAPAAARAALDEEGIDEAELAAQNAAHLEAAARHATAGDFAGLETYNQVYVETLERGRGAISPAEYGRIVVGTERGNLDAVLEALKMPGARFVHIERHWLTRMSADGELFRESMRGIREARRG